MLSFRKLQLAGPRVDRYVLVSKGCPQVATPGGSEPVVPLVPWRVCAVSD